MVEIGSRQKYQYDAANRLVQVKNDSDVTIASYTYGSSERAEPLNCRKCKLELKHRRKCKSEKKRQAVVENTARRARTVRWNHLFGVICGSELAIEASASATERQCTTTSHSPLSPAADFREMKPVVSGRVATRPPCQWAELIGCNARIGFERYDFDDRASCSRCAHDGKHLPKASSNRGDPLSRIFRRSNAQKRFRSPARNPSHVSESAMTLRFG